MSDSRPTGPRSLSPLWLLLLLPLGLVAGRLIAHLPTPAPAATDTAVHGGLAPAGSTAPHVAGMPARGGDATPAPAPAAAQSEPAREPEAQSQPAGDGTMHWLALEDAWNESQRTGKPVMIDFNADWCGPCQQLRHTVFENPAVAGAIDAAVIPVSIVDRVREEGSNPPETANLQQRFGVTAFPTLVIFSPATGKVVRTVGAGGPEETRDWIVSGAAAVR